MLFDANRRPRVSVIIPVYNGARYLGEAVASVRAQREVTDWEIVIVDDGSTDGTSDVIDRCRSEEPRVRLLPQSHRGIAPSRNAGVSAARGDFLAFLDADDLWEPAKLHRQLALAEASDSPAMVFSLVTEFASPDLEAEAFVGIAVREAPMPGLCASALLAPREIFSRVGPFDESLASGEFIDWHARASEAGVVSRSIDEVLVRRRIHLANHGRVSRSDYARDYRKLLRNAIKRRRKTE